MRRDRDVALLPAKIVGRRREGKPTPRDVDILLRTAWDLRGTGGLAPRGLFRFHTFEQAQDWLTSQMSRRSARRPSTTSERPAE